MQVTLTWDKSALRIGGADAAVRKSLTQAGSSAIRAARAASNRLIREKKRIKVRTLNAGLSLSFPRGAKDIDDLEWRLRVSGKPIPLAAYPHRQTKRGVVVAVNKGRAKVLIRGAFIAVMRSGHRGVFMRTTTKRLPIREGYSTRLTDVFRDPGVVPATLNRAQAVFISTYDRVLPINLRK